MSAIRGSRFFGMKRTDQHEGLCRFFAPDLRPGTIRLPAAEAHHAVNVLRLKPGAAAELFDGRGRTAVGTIAQSRRGEAAVTVERVEGPADRPEPVVHLAFAVPKGKRLDWLLEKATELGAASLHPVVFERSVAGGKELSAGKRDRWLGHCIAAAKQCGLNFLPEIRDPVGCAALFAAHQTRRDGTPPRPCQSSGVQQTAMHALRLVGDLGADAAPVAEALAKRQAGQEVLILIGPEGGLTQEERVVVLRAGFIPVRLGGTTLRIETAAIALLAATVAMGAR
jgi:16S rRNA (uracil1498-N3)-methyltransferase